jgi:hypothetical protein
VAQSTRIHIRHKAGQTVLPDSASIPLIGIIPTEKKHNGRGNARGMAVNWVAFNPQETMNCE